MSGSDEAIDTSWSIQIHMQWTRSPAFWAFYLAIVCCAINCMHRSFGTVILPYIRNDLNWSLATISFWTGFLGFLALLFSFVGGFIGDRTLKRKAFAGAGFLAVGIGILLIATMNAALVKLGFVLAGLGMLLFLGNILVVVTELAASVKIKIETAFVVVFGAVILGDSVSILVSINLLEHNALYSALVVVTITFGLLWLLVLRNLPVTHRAEIPLALSSSRRGILLILAFVATRAMSFIVMSAFEWMEKVIIPTAGLEL